MQRLHDAVARDVARGETKYRARLLARSVYRINDDDEIGFAHMRQQIHSHAPCIIECDIVAETIARFKRVVHRRANTVVKHKSIANAENRDFHQSPYWPSSTGVTRVERLGSMVMLWKRSAMKSLP